MARTPDVAGLPWPEGDPGALKDAAGNARDLAAAVRQAGSRLSKAARPGDDWKGQAASSFVSVVRDDGRDLEKAAGSFSSAAGAVSKLAMVLDDAQDEVKRWARKVKDAEERARTADEQAAQAATKLEQAQARANPLLPALGPADPMAPFTAPAESAAYGSAQRDAADARGDLSAVRTKAKDEAAKAVKKVKQTDQDAAAKIKAAADKAPMGGRKGGSPLAGLDLEDLVTGGALLALALGILSPSGKKPSRLDRMEAVAKKSRLGRRALELQEKYKTKVTFKDGGGSYFEPDSNTMVLDSTQDTGELAAVFVHEMNHARYHHEGRSADATKVSRRQYVRSRVNEEAVGTVSQIRANLELRKAGVDVSEAPVERQYLEAVREAEDAAKKADPKISSSKLREIGRKAGFRRVVRAFEEGEVETSTNGQAYPEYYGSYWDRVNE